MRKIILISTVFLTAVAVVSVIQLLQRDSGRPSSEAQAYIPPIDTATPTKTCTPNVTSTPFPCSDGIVMDTCDSTDGWSNCGQGSMTNPDEGGDHGPKITKTILTATVKTGALVKKFYLIPGHNYDVTLDVKVNTTGCTLYGIFYAEGCNNCNCPTTMPAGSVNIRPSTYNTWQNKTLRTGWTSPTGYACLVIWLSTIQDTIVDIDNITIVDLNAPTCTYTPSNTFTSTPTATNTNTPTRTPTPSFTSFPTHTPTPTKQVIGQPLPLPTGSGGVYSFDASDPPYVHGWLEGYPYVIRVGEEWTGPFLETLGYIDLNFGTVDLAKLHLNLPEGFWLSYGACYPGDDCQVFEEYGDSDLFPTPADPWNHNEVDGENGTGGGPFTISLNSQACYESSQDCPAEPEDGDLETEIIAVGVQFIYDAEDIPRSVSQAPMEITVQLNPAGVHLAPGSSVTLTITEPSHEQYKYRRILTSPIIENFTSRTFVFLWDGVLYDNDGAGSLSKYTQRSDVFMTATVDLLGRILDQDEEPMEVTYPTSFNNIAFSFPGPNTAFFDVRERLKYPAYLWNDRIYFNGAERVPAGPDNDGSDNYRVGYWIKSGSDKVRAYIKYRYDNEYENMVELTSNVQWFYFNQHGEGVWEDVPEEIVIDSIDLTPSSQIGDIQIGYQIKHTDNQSQTKYYSAGTISLTALSMLFTHPDPIPHKDSDSAPVTVGCELRPDLGAIFDSQELRIWDPPNVSTRYLTWNVSSRIITEPWDGKFDNIFTRASDIFMRSTVHLKNGEVFTFNETRAAFTVSAIGDEDPELEVGDNFTAQAYANNITPTSYLWDFQGKAFRADIIKPEGQYTTSDLLRDPQELRQATVQAKYITGDKSAVDQTDLGDRTITLDIENLDAPVTSYTLPVVVKKVEDAHAKITFYYCPYEVNEGFPGNMIQVSINNGPPNSIWIDSAFAEASHINGTGKLYKIRTSDMQKDQGNTPSASQQYIHAVRKVGDPPQYTFRFVSDIRGALNTELQRQDAAKYYWSSGPHYSYYNFSTYSIEGLEEYVNNVKIPTMNQDNDDFPDEFSGDGISVEDRGPYAEGKNQAVDEKHLDIFVEPTGSNGVNPLNMAKLGFTWLKVVK